jgi:phosphopantothenoylcysteine decarboxylase/phosphopantothenate--cysteine ligase
MQSPASSTRAGGVLDGAAVAVGVSGSIAAYKAAYLVSSLAHAGCQVDVLMTPAAARLVSPLTFQALTHRAVITDLWSPSSELAMDHLAVARRARLMLVAPATADIMARLAHGLADDAVTATALACRGPLVIAPAMETSMWQHPATQDNLLTLRERDAIIVPPESGHLASGAEGVGRMAEPATILGHVRSALGRGGRLAGRKVLVTAGPTEEPIDVVRVVSNRSSGRMGYAMAEAARDAGAEVTLISGPTCLAPVPAAQMVYVRTAQEMLQAVTARLEGTDVLIMSAAVADFRPQDVSQTKMDKSAGPPDLNLIANPDILLEVRRVVEGGQRLTVVGFAAESQDIIQRARRKLESKGLALVVANRVPETLGADQIRASIIDRSGHVRELAEMPKTQAAEIIISVVADLLPR